MPMKYKLMHCDDDFSLIAPLWFAIGTMSVFHALLKHQSLPVLSAQAVSRCHCRCGEFVNQGLAACVSAEGIGGELRNTLQYLFAESLASHGFALSFHQFTPGCEAHWCVIHSPLGKSTMPRIGVRDVVANPTPLSNCGERGNERELPNAMHAVADGSAKRGA